MSYFDHVENRSTLNEVDNAMKEVILKLMTFIDNRRDESEEPIWTEDKIFMTPTQDIDDIYSSYQLKTGDNFTVPVIAYTPSPTLTTVDHTYGNRMNVAAISISKTVNGEKIPLGYSRLKHFESSYKVTVWDSDYKSMRFYQDKIALKGVDNEFYTEYESEILRGYKLPFTYLVGLPVINTIPNASTKIGGSGFLYALGFEIKVWGILADEPVDESKILQINMDLVLINNEKELKDWQISINGNEEN